VRLNKQHPSPLKPSWNGDSIGHYEGDTLGVDTVGVNPNRKYAMIDLFGIAAAAMQATSVATNQNASRRRHARAVHNLPKASLRSLNG
jgi:hypothetical protein